MLETIQSIHGFLAVFILAVLVIPLTAGPRVLRWH